MAAPLLSRSNSSAARAIAMLAAVPATAVSATTGCTWSRTGDGEVSQYMASAAPTAASVAATKPAQPCAEPKASAKLNTAMPTQVAKTRLRRRRSTMRGRRGPTAAVASRTPDTWAASTPQAGARKSPSTSAASCEESHPKPDRPRDARGIPLRQAEQRDEAPPGQDPHIRRRTVGQEAHVATPSEEGLPSRAATGLRAAGRDIADAAAGAGRRAFGD